MKNNINKIFVLLLSSMFSLTSCGNKKIDTKTLDENKVKDKIIFREINESDFFYNGNKYQIDDKIDNLLYSDGTNLYFQKLIKDGEIGLVKSNLDGTNATFLHSFNTDLLAFTYDGKIMTKRLVDNVSTFEIYDLDYNLIDSFNEKDNLEKYQIVHNGFTTYRVRGESITFTYNDILYKVDLDFLKEKSNIPSFIKEYEKQLEIDVLKVKGTDIYFSATLTYNFKNNYYLVFKIEDEGCKFIDYFYYTVYNVEYVIK